MKTAREYAGLEGLQITPNPRYFYDVEELDPDTYRVYLHDLKTGRHQIIDTAGVSETNIVLYFKGALVEVDPQWMLDVVPTADVNQPYRIAAYDRIDPAKLHPILDGMKWTNFMDPIHLLATCGANYNPTRLAHEVPVRTKDGEQV